MTIVAAVYSSYISPAALTVGNSEVGIGGHIGNANFRAVGKRDSNLVVCNAALRLLEVDIVNRDIVEPDEVVFVNSVNVVTAGMFIAVAIGVAEILILEVEEGLFAGAAD